MKRLTEKGILHTLIKILILSIVLICSACKGGDSNTDTLVDGKGGTEYNFVVIITDDQREDTLWAMPIVTDKLADQGITFSNSYVSMPLCAPFRASLLAGGFYSHNTGILRNVSPNGGVQKFIDDETLATHLQGIGYKTALIGKYLNEYPEISPYIPPGWTKFVTVRPHYDWFNSNYVLGSSGEVPTQGEEIGPVSEYITDFLKEQALDFLNQHQDSPFFLYFTPIAPHGPATPAIDDENLFSNYLYRDRAYGEEDLSDKPRWVRKIASDHGNIFNTKEEEDEFHRDQLRSLQAVDRAVGEIIEKVEEIGKLNQTIFFFTSDNGFMWGEHGLFYKGKPYEESIRVPFIVRMPGVQPRIDDHLVIVNLDIAATIFDLSALSRETDGLSLMPLINETNSFWREEVLIQNFNTWAGLRIKEGQEEWKYVEYTTGEFELYDLLNDPYEEESKHDDPAYQDIIAEKSERLAKLKGLIATFYNLPSGKVGEEYNFQLKAWGGEEPYVWSIIDGQLPEGLVLDNVTGMISGVPVLVEEQHVSINVEDPSVATHTGMPQSYIRDSQIIIE